MTESNQPKDSTRCSKDELWQVENDRTKGEAELERQLQEKSKENEGDVDLNDPIKYAERDGESPDETDVHTAWSYGGENGRTASRSLAHYDFRAPPQASPLGGEEMGLAVVPLPVPSMQLMNDLADATQKGEEEKLSSDGLANDEEGYTKVKEEGQDETLLNLQAISEVAANSIGQLEKVESVEGASTPVKQELGAIINENTSLHHRLLGPSLGKAGQDDVDQERVARIMYEAGKGSKFFENAQLRDQKLTRKIEATLAKKAQLDKFGYKRETRQADEYLAKLEATRDLTQCIVHIDCDAFYATIEELDNPALKDVPMAVGQGDFGVLTTANYNARKFGVRSGMAEHIAKKLCPDLVMIQPDYRKYMRKAREIRVVLSGYDDQMEAASIDEAYLNITDYCEATGRDPDSVVEEMRKKVFEATKMTISVGIGANDLIAKIAANKNKPNGQFRVPNTKEACMEFMADLPCRKVPGIGESWERQLAAVGIHKVKDIYTHRGILKPLFVEAIPNFLFQVYLGLGRTKLQPASEYERKSVGSERTFRAISGSEALRERLRITAQILEHDLAEAGAEGRTIVLTVKMDDFRSFTRQRVLHKTIRTADDLYHYATPLLRNLEAEFGPGMKIRLMGLRLEDLSPVSRVAPTSFDDLGGPVDFVKRGNMQLGRIPRLPESDFADLPPMQKSPRKPKPVPPPKEMWSCPICGKMVDADDRIFNEHVDGCLSREAVKEVVKGTFVPPRREEPRREPPPRFNLDVGEEELIARREATASPSKRSDAGVSPRKRKRESSAVPGVSKRGIDAFFQRKGS